MKDLLRATPTLLLLTLLAVLPARAQNMALFQKAVAAVEAGRYAEAGRLYERMLSGWSGASSSTPALHYAAAASFAQAGQADKAFDHLRTALDEGFGPLKKIRQAESLQSLHADPRWAPLIAAAEEARASMNTALRDELLTMVTKDQQARNALIEAGVASPPDSLKTRMRAIEP